MKEGVIALEAAEFRGSTGGFGVLQITYCAHPKAGYLHVGVPSM